MLYFDHNATGPLLPAARAAWLEAVERYPANPSSPHRAGARAEAALADARARLAALLGCDALDLVWTSGATESSNTVLHHATRTLSGRAEVWTSSIEHPCVLAAAGRHFGPRHHLIPVTTDGVLDLEWLERQLRRRRPGLVVLMAANNETGVLQPWRQAAALCRERDLPFFCDAAQWVGRLPVAGLGACDFVSGCAHKCGGPKGVGFLKCPPRGRVEPLLVGGPQEHGRRAGTENLPGILALVTALEQREAELGSPPGTFRKSSPPQSAVPLARRHQWRSTFERELLASLPGSAIIGARAERLWNTVSALMPNLGPRARWVVKLDKAGFAVSSGSACASGREEPSHVLAAMGYPATAGDRVLRFSSAWETPPEHWEALLDGLREVLRTSIARNPPPAVRRRHA